RSVLQARSCWCSCGRRGHATPQSTEGSVGGLPLLALLCQLGSPGIRHLVVFAPPTLRRRAPLRTDVAEPLEAVQQRVEHAVGPLDVTAGQLTHALENGIAVAGALDEDGEHKRCGHRGNQVFVDVHDASRYSSVYLTALGT